MSDLTAITKPLSGAAILAKVKVVDGAGSGLDADTVQGWAPPTGFVSAGLAGGLQPYPSPALAPRGRVTEFRN